MSILKAGKLNIFKNKSFLIPLLSFSLTIIAGVSAGSVFHRDFSTIIPEKSTLPLAHSFDRKIVISDIKTYNSLPVADVKSFPVLNPKGTVIYIPQYHKNPGTESSDKKNDSAEIAQTEIYKILSFLHKEAGVGLIMMEGELFGPVPTDKIAFTAKKIEDTELLKDQSQKLRNALSDKSLDSSTERSLFDGINQEISRIERDAILSGAPLMLKIKDPDKDRDVVLYGSENLLTRNKSADIVRDYVYLQDRMDQLNQVSSGRFSNAFEAPGSSADNSENNWLKLLQTLNFRNPLGDEFRILESLASSKGYTDVFNLLKGTEDAFNNLLGNQKQSTASISTSSSRSDNPYKNIFNKSEIEQMMKEDEKRINEIVVDQRNRETAQNFASALSREKKNIGILQFGAGHEDGLIKELNKQGLSVVEIVSNEVDYRNGKGE